MSTLPLSLAALLAALPASAALSPNASSRIAAMTSGALPALGVSALSFEPDLQIPRVLGHSVRAQSQGGPLVPRSMWDAAQALTAAQAQFLAGRIPGFDAAKTRAASYAQVSGVVGETARRGDSNLDLFSDEGLRGDVAYYLSGDVVAQLFREFDLAASLKQSGVAKDGRPFKMVGIVMGRGHVHILYDLDNFEFDNDGKTYKALGRITQTILGDGVLGVSGLWVHVWPFTPQIQKLTKLGNGKMRVDTNKGSRDMADNPIRRR